MTTNETIGVDVNGDYALYLFHDDQEPATDNTPVIRFWNLDHARNEAERLIKGAGKGGSYRYLWLGKWNYITEDDDIEIQEFRAE